MAGIGFSKSISGFDPRSIPGCQLWLDAADSNTMTLSGSKVSQWNDKSGNSRNATQATSANQPTYSSSSVVFTTANSTYMSLPDGSIWSSNSPLSIFCVMSPTSTYATNVFLFQGLVSGSAAIGLYTTGTTFSDYWQGNGANTWGSMTSGTKYLIGYVYTQNTNIYGYQSGTGTLLRTTAAYTVNVSNATIGGERERGFYANANINELIIFNTTVTTSQRQLIEGYLAWKWGLYNPLPLTIPNCLLWFDAADTSTITGTTQVTRWNSKGSNSTYASNFTGSCTSGNTYNGLNFIRCPAGTEMRFTTALNTQARSWFVVARLVSTLTSGTYAGIVNATVSGSDSLVISYVNATSNNIYESPNSVSVTTAANVSPSVLATPFIVSSVNSATVGSNVLTINGTSQTLTSSAAASGYNTGNIAYVIGTAGYNTTIDIMEIIFYSGDVTPSQRQQVEGYLAWKWGLNSNLAYPTNIPGCALWLDGNDSTTMFQDTAGTTPVTANGQNVAQWRDKSTNSFAFITGTGAGGPPTYNTNALNSRSGVTFGSVDSSTTFSTNFKWLDSSSTINCYNSFTLGGSNTTIFAVVNVNAVTQHNRLFTSINLDMEILFPWTSGGFIWDMPYNSAANRLIVTTYPTTTGGQLVSLVRSGATMTGYSNGTSFGSISTASGTLTNSASTVHIGGFFNTSDSTYYTFNSNICEMLIFNRDLATSERQQIEGYLSLKWGLPTNAQNIHPYYFSPPSSYVGTLPAVHPFYSIKPFSRVFQPTDIPGCQVWFDAADTSTLTTSGSTVTAWKDKSQNNWSATTLIGTAPSTTTVNGRNAVSFPSASTLTVSNVTLNGQARAMFCVYNNTGGSSTQYVSAFDVQSPTSTSFGGVNYWQPTGATMTFFAHTSTGDTSILAGSGTSIAASSTNIMEFVQSAVSTSSNFIGINGVSQTIATSQLATTYPTATTNYFIGNAYSTPAILCDYLLYIGEMTTAQRQAIEGYLAWKWSLTSSLPSTHPFKTIPPSTLQPIDQLYLNNGGAPDAFIAQYNTTGGLQWAARISGQGGDYGYGVATDSTGVYVTGYYMSSTNVYNASGTLFGTLSNINLAYDVFIVKYNTSGSVQWSSRIAGSSNDQGYGIASDSTGAYVTGRYISTPVTVYNASGTSFTTLTNTGGNYYAFIVKYNSSGTALWAAQVGGGATTGTQGNAIATDSTGVYVTGYYAGGTITAYNASGTAFGTTLALTGSSYCTFIVKYNTSGVVQWVTNTSGTSGGVDIGYGIATDSTGVYVGGRYSSTTLTIYNSGGTSFGTLANAGGDDGFIVKYNTSGAVQWIARIAGTGYEAIRSIATDSTGVYVTGYYNSSPVTVYNASGTSFGTLTNAGSYNVFIVKYSTSGVVQWTARIGGTATDFGYGITTDSTGVYVTGYYTSSPVTIYNASGTSFTTLALTGTQNVFTVKYNTLGVVQWASRTGGSGTPNDNTYGIATDSGSVYVTGQYSSAPMVLYSSGY